MAITVKHLKVSAIPDSGDDSLIEPSDWNADHQLVGTVPVANGGTGAATLTGYVKGNGTSTMTASATIPNTDITGLGTASTKDAGSANGVATLDSGGQIPLSQIPPLGDLVYQGTWDASLNIPILVSSVGVKGYYYVVNVAGSTNLNGITDWQIGDWAVFNGLVWQKIDNTDSVTSVNGYTGTVVLGYADVGAANSGTNTNITSMTGLTGGITTPDFITFDTTPETIPTAEGSLYWDSADGNQTLSLVMAGGTATQQIGEEQYYRIKASSAITNGQVVMFTGSVGASGALTGAPATGLTASTASYIMGIATQDITLNGWGYVTSFGLVRNLDTSAFNDGDILYYNPSVTGGLTTSIPAAPNAKVQICAVTHAATNGSLFVRLSFGGTLGQYEGDVQVTSPANGQLLIRDQTAGKWVNAALTAGTAISVTDTAGAVTIANTAPDQVVSLTAGTGISTSGTYPSFTVTNTAPDQTVVMTSGTGISVTGTYPNFTVTNTSPSSGGTVTSVSGTAPIVSSGGNTPAISITQATTSTNGYLSSTDWNTFNNKGSGTVTAVSVASANGFAGTSSGGATPALTLTTSISGVLKGNGTAISAATAGTDYAGIDTAQTFTKGQRGEVTALTDGATITPDFSDSNNFSVTLGGNRTLANPSNLVAGQSGVILITQDGTGSRTLAYGSYWKFSGGTAPTLTTTASAVDALAYYVGSSTQIDTVFIGNLK